jgi:tetratricopeptide (TPR) repeat protein
MRVRHLIALAAITGVIVTSAHITSVAAARRARDDAAADLTTAATADVRRQQALTFYEKRLIEDPISALDMAQLAALYLEQGRSRGDPAAFARAEVLARASLATRGVRNGRSASLLSNTLMAEHQFVEARDIARSLVAADSETPAYRALLAEADLELGDYDQTRTLIASVWAQRADLGIAPRFARWAELTGHPDEARRILRDSRDDAMRRGDLSGDQRAWYHLRIADLELRYGRLRGAALALRAGLAAAPHDWRLLAASARLDAARGDWRRAAAFGERVIAIVADPATLALLADSYEALGDSSAAQSYEDALDGAASAQPGPIHRAWSLHLLDHGRLLDDVLARAAADTLARRDIYGFDLLSWALYRTGRFADALVVSRRALQLGTSEPSIVFHAGIIEEAAGAHEDARAHLASAFEGQSALTPAQRQMLRRSHPALGPVR